MSSTISAPLSNLDPSSAERFDLVEMLLADQQSMTAVERFSARHEAASSGEPDQARFYRDLMPATPPGPGQQFAFRVDLDACSGCKACVVACHTMNGLEDDESWRRVGTITVGEKTEPRIQHVTTACHHCEEPGCLSGCPVKAYDKDPSTGIVRHLDDQCIGCKYCTMMCPYEVPQYSDRLGIVRKCDMCHQRLSVGEAPACVQSCPNEAISIQVVETDASVPKGNDRLAPGAPLSTITRPSTCYSSNHETSIREAVPQDAGVDRVAESHWPLAVMLVATQISVGMLLAERLAATGMWAFNTELPVEVTRINALFAFVVGVVGLSIAPLHLGQPLRAWRVFLGLRTSWLSREAVVLGKYVGALAGAVGLLYLPDFVDHVPEFISSRVASWAAIALLGIAVLLGIAGLFCSGMIYVATRRQLWRHARTLPRFFGTAVVGGVGCCVISLLYAEASMLVIAMMFLSGAALLAIKLAWEWRIHLGPADEADDVYDGRSRLLVNEHLSFLQRLRLGVGVAGVVLLFDAMFAALMGLSAVAMVTAMLAATLIVIGEGCERLLYFKSVVHDRMPGTL